MQKISIVSVTTFGAGSEPPQQQHVMQQHDGGFVGPSAVGRLSSSYSICKTVQQKKLRQFKWQ
jgi:hypothetical protein